MYDKDNSVVDMGVDITDQVVVIISEDYLYNA